MEDAYVCMFVCHYGYMYTLLASENYLTGLAVHFAMHFFFYMIAMQFGGVATFSIAMCNRVAFGNC